MLVGKLADVAPFAWLDALIAIGVGTVIFSLYRRHFLAVAYITAGAYLFFFWTWGLNYHRVPLTQKLQFDARAVTPASIERFRLRAAAEINRLYFKKEAAGFEEARIRGTVNSRVRHVVAVLDGQTWEAARKVKVSFFLNPYFLAAGVEGAFNPFGHEPVVSDGLVPEERPLVIAHELAHVRGYPNEGDAQFIAFLATVTSDDPLVQYSGWISTWLYLRNPELDRLLDEGPKHDLERIFTRMREQTVHWVSLAQTAILDWYLKANKVEGGVRSYSRVVLLAVGTQESWERFK